MDEIGNIIYILFIIVMVILSIFRKSKKKQQKQVFPKKQSSSPQPQSKEQMTASDVLTELFGKEVKEDFPTAETVYKPSRKKILKKEKIPVTEGSSEYELLKERLRKTRKTTIVKKFSPIYAAEEENVIDLSTINWRDAIIYSEILSPKF